MFEDLYIISMGIINASGSQKLFIITLIDHSAPGSERSGFFQFVG